MRQGHHIRMTLQVDLIAALLDIVCCVVHRHCVPLFEVLASNVNLIMIMIHEHGQFRVVLVAQNASEEVVF